MDETQAAETAFAEAIVELADTLRPEHDVIDTMDRLVAAATAVTPAVDAGIVLADAQGALRVVASTSERAAEVEEAQLGADEGPCLEAYRSAAPVESTRLDAERDRWPRFVELAEQSGFRAVYAVPLTLRGHHLGAVGIFFDRPEALDDRSAALVQAMAQVATIAVVQQRTIAEHADLAAQLQRALDARVLIEQAKGLVASRHGISIDAAYQLLRGQARREQRRLRDLAEELVNGHLAL
ncbi:GAF and ANTAR domain-containing protein [Herbiconiux sp.]|uniref:GAF and ANTAR domain-containing protein n=1 Tax=Herbiconiux sp. TaxID=1871186 RepID=UPI0025B96AAE|nr:GAF and ANTAR domain-containing protein [Herbiconiux sp.]